MAIKTTNTTSSGNSHVEEIAGLIVIASSLFFLLALATYSPSDKSFNSFSTASSSVDNLGGMVGAYLADASLQLFGLASYIIPALALLIGIFLMLKRKISLKEAGKVAGLLMLMFSVSTLLSLMDTGKGTAVRGGGMTGNMLATVLSGYLNNTGAYLFTAVALILSLILSTGISAVTATKGTVAWIVIITARMARFVKGMLQKYRERRRRLRETNILIKEEETKKKY